MKIKWLVYVSVVYQSAAVSGEVYRLRARSQLREGLAEDEANSSVQFVSTTISAVSCHIIS